MHQQVTATAKDSNNFSAWFSRALESENNTTALLTTFVMFIQLMQS